MAALHDLSEAGILAISSMIEITVGSTSIGLELMGECVAEDTIKGAIYLVLPLVAGFTM